ncbi:MAG: SDR family NAD(P)-dependent oxidoreductase, partial [Chloroflexota bacterium]
MMDIQGKTVLVTGAGSGLGRACALLAAREGANLALGDIDGGGLETTMGEVEQAGGRAVSHVVDVRRPEDCAALADLAVRNFGRLDGAVCSAGVDRIVPALEMTLDEWERVIGVNLTGTFLSVQASVRVMLPNPGGGSIITFASGIAVRGRAGGAHYAASKAGIVALTKSFALEFGPQRIRVNAI